MGSPTTKRQQWRRLGGVLGIEWNGTSFGGRLFLCRRRNF